MGGDGQAFLYPSFPTPVKIEVEVLFMESLKLKENLYYVGCIDHGLKVFDSVMPLPYGTSYNSYLLKTTEGVVLFEGSKAGFADEYIEHISSLTSLSDIKYLVVAHTEPDHSGAIEALLKKSPDITVIASPAGINNLKNILRFSFKSLVMAPGKELKVGQYTLRFISGLFLHWPDVLFTYIVEEKALVSCDAFGTHYAFDEILYSKVKDYKEYRESFDYYFECIMAPFASFALQAVAKVRALPLDLILTGHGPVVDKDTDKVIDAFEEEAKKWLPVLDANHITLVYTSCYGYTAEMAEYLKAQLEKRGKTVSFFAIDALNYASSKADILEAIRTSGLVLFGTPTIAGDAISMFYDLLLSRPIPFFTNKGFAAFGDYGWSGEGPKNITDFALTRKMKTLPSFKWCFKVNEEGKSALDAWLTEIGQ